MVGDSSFAALELLAALAPRMACIPRLRLDACLYEPAPPRVRATKGRPRKKGARLAALPIGWVLIRDPLGRFEPQALLCTRPGGVTAKVKADRDQRRAGSAATTALAARPIIKRCPPSTKRGSTR